MAGNTDAGSMRSDDEDKKLDFTWDLEVLWDEGPELTE